MTNMLFSLYLGSSINNLFMSREKVLLLLTFFYVIFKAAQQTLFTV